MTNGNNNFHSLTAFFLIFPALCGEWVFLNFHFPPLNSESERRLSFFHLFYYANVRFL